MENTEKQIRDLFLETPARYVAYVIYDCAIGGIRTIEEAEEQAESVRLKLLTEGYELAEENNWKYMRLAAAIPAEGGTGAV